MSFSALARDLAKSRIVCCWGTDAPARSHGTAPRAAVSIALSCTGPQVPLSPCPQGGPGMFEGELIAAIGA